MKNLAYNDLKYLTFKHYLLLVLGSLLGLFLAAFIQSLSLPYGWNLEKARSLGIVSQTILDGYPKERDVIGYVVLLVSTVGCGVALWWGWARNKRNAFHWLTAQDIEAETSRYRLFLLAALSILVPFLLWYNQALFTGPVDSWFLFGEEGVMLSAVNDILAGKIQGRDFFGPHGPIMTLLLSWTMKQFGRGVLIARYFSFGLHMVSYLVTAFILHRIIKHTAFSVLFLILFIVIFPVNVIPHSTYLRFTLGIVPIVVFALSRSRYSDLIAGLILGQALLFSQEAGICSAVALLFVWLFRKKVTYSGRVRQGLVLLVSCFVSLLPFIVYAAVKGGLGAFISNLIEYPTLIALGYCALPFPLLDTLLGNPTGSPLVYYWPVFVYVAALLYVLPPFILGSRVNRHIFIAALTLYGILLFRIALGRSDGAHLLNATPPAFLLFAALADRCWEQINSALLKARKSMLTRTVVMSVVSLFSLFLLLPLTSGNVKIIIVRQLQGVSAKNIFPTGFSYSALPALDGILLGEDDYRQTEMIHFFLKKNLKKDESVYFFPNEPLLYFLFNLPSPTRFHQAYQAVTTEQRLEAVRDLERIRPKYLVYNYNYKHRIDGVPEQIQVPEIVQYLQLNYSLCVQANMLAIFVRRGDVCSAN